MERMDTFQIGKNGKYRSLDVLLSIEVGYSTKGKLDGCWKRKQWEKKIKEMISFNVIDA